MVRLSPAGPELPGVRVVRGGEGAATHLGKPRRLCPLQPASHLEYPHLGNERPLANHLTAPLRHLAGSCSWWTSRPPHPRSARTADRLPRIPMFGLLPAHQHPRMHSSAGQRIGQPPECNRPRKNAIPPRPDDTDSTETHPQHRDAPVSHDQFNDQGPDPADQPQGGQVTHPG
jgi:hypothetical protein